MKWLPFGTSDEDRAQPFRTANKNRLGEYLVMRLLLLPATGRTFEGVYVYAHPATQALRKQPQMPVIYCLTHTGWWDGYMAGLLNRRAFHRDTYLMMEDQSLAQYPFFTWIGVYGVDRHDPRKALASVEYTTRLLSEAPGRAVCVFPQGTITHADKRPLGVFGGVAHVARRLERCAVVPVALRYEFRLEQAPQAFAHIGPPILLNSAVEKLPAREITALLDTALSDADDTLHVALVADELYNYRPILRGRTSVSRVWLGLLDRVGTARDKLLAGR